MTCHVTNNFGPRGRPPPPRRQGHGGSELRTPTPRPMLRPPVASAATSHPRARERPLSSEVSPRPLFAPLIRLPNLATSSGNTGLVARRRSLPTQRSRPSGASAPGYNAQTCSDVEQNVWLYARVSFAEVYALTAAVDKAG